MLPASAATMHALSLYDVTTRDSPTACRPQRMDPQLRKLMEVAYEAWTDSGINHLALRGSDRVSASQHSQLMPMLTSSCATTASSCCVALLVHRSCHEEAPEW